MPVNTRSSTRRQFLAAGAALAAVAGGAPARGGSGGQAPGPSRASPSPGAPGRQVVVGVMGTSRDSAGGDGRGTHLAATLAGLAVVHVAYVCDVDSRNVPKAIEAVARTAADGLPVPHGVSDFRRILDDAAVDALVIAAPDHWHAPAAILACRAGKHVYVEKPCSHNPREGELLVEAAAKHKRHVQHGTQRRTWPAIREAVERLRAGDIGRVVSARAFYWSDRPTIGRGNAGPAPAWLDWPMWQGPAPAREYLDNVLHYHWHWRWHWGTGELGNNGVHAIDLARWGLGADCPTRVSYVGGKYRHPDDDQETPDTGVATFEFGGGKLLTWENRSWAARTPLDADYEVLFSGEKGFLAIRGDGYTVYDLKGAAVGKGSGDGGDAGHLQNFVDAVRGDAALNAPIDEGHASTLLCHLGNISYRTGRTLHVDPKTRRIVSGGEDAAAVGALWAREYQPGWEPAV